MRSEFWTENFLEKFFLGCDSGESKDFLGPLCFVVGSDMVNILAKEGEEEG